MFNEILDQDLSGASYQFAGHCVFCGNTGLTSQHIWTKRLDKSFLFEEDHSIIETKTMQSSRILRHVRKNGGLHKRKIRNVCRICNEGWIKKLEEAAFRYIPYLVNGRNCVIDGDAKRVLSSWFCVVCIMAEYLDEKSQAIQVNDRTHIMEKSSCPENWFVWLGRYVGSSWHPFRYRHHGIQIGIKSQPKPQSGLNFHVTSNTIGNLFIMACSSPPEVFSSGLSEVFTSYLCCIWPENCVDVDFHDLPVVNDAILDKISMCLVEGFERFI